MAERKDASSRVRVAALALVAGLAVGPLGTHVFTAVADQPDGRLRWMVVSPADPAVSASSGCSTPLSTNLPGQRSRNCLTPSQSRLSCLNSAPGGAPLVILARSRSGRFACVGMPPSSM